MLVFILTLGLMTCVFAMMSIGLTRNKPLTGSCGNVWENGGTCQVCGKTAEEMCAKPEQTASKTKLYKKAKVIDLD